MNESLWWKGVAAWYSHDFFFAMEVWAKALPLTRPISAQDLISTLQKWGDEKDSNYQTHKVAEVSGAYTYAPLELFLAGCFMDAGRYAEARGLLLRVILGGNLEIRTRAIRECIASIDEDPSISENCLDKQNIARNLIKYAIQQGSFIWRDPLQRPGFIYPNINSKPTWNKENFPSWCRILENNWKLIRTELESVLCHQWPAVGSGDHRGGAGAHDGTVVTSGDWRELVLFGAGAENCSYGGRFSPSACRVTRQLILQHVPDAVDLAQRGGGEIIFSKLSPRTRIASHCGTTNVRLTAHLGLIVPCKGSGRCEIRVGDQWSSWDEGKMIVIDDSYEHEVVNETDNVRCVLLLRFWHPDLPKTERENALEQALKAKQNDSLSRYNPPFPPHESNTQQKVHSRGMEQSCCKTCGRTGFETIRLQQYQQKYFTCLCGASID